MECGLQFVITPRQRSLEALAARPRGSGSPAAAVASIRHDNSNPRPYSDWHPQGDIRARSRPVRHQRHIHRQKHAPNVSGSVHSNCAELPRCLPSVRIPGRCRGRIDVTLLQAKASAAARRSLQPARRPLPSFVTAVARASSVHERRISALSRTHARAPAAGKHVTPHPSRTRHRLPLG